MTESRNGSLTVHLRCELDAMQEARDAVDSFDQLPQDTFDALKLTVSELVANSVGHAGLDGHDLIDLVIETHADHVRVDVHDRGLGFALPDSPLGRSRGYGFPMVQRLTRHFGISRTAPTTHAWAEIALA